MGARCCTNDSSIDKTSLIKDRPTTVSNGPNMKVNEGKALFSLIVGEWIGQCQTVKGFEYGEEIKFIDKNQPFLTYLSQTWKKGEKKKKKQPKSKLNYEMSESAATLKKLNTKKKKSQNK
eukprot:41859_1